MVLPRTYPNQTCNTQFRRRGRRLRRHFAGGLMHLFNRQKIEGHDAARSLQELLRLSVGLFHENELSSILWGLIHIPARGYRITTWRRSSLTDRQF